MNLINDLKSIKRAARLGLGVLLIFLCIFTLWSLFAPIESASVAPGIVIVKTSRKTIQHLEGGIIKKILVSEGSTIKENDVLIQLDDTQAKTAYDLFHGQAMALLANYARLTATVNNKDTINWPPLLLLHQNENVAQTAMALQEKLFTADRNALKGQIEILHSRMKQVEDEIQSLRAQIKSKSRQLTLIGEEVKAVAYLEAKKLIDKPRLWALQREEAKLQGDVSEAEQQVSKALEQISEIKQQAITLQDTTQKNTTKELYETESKLTDILERRKNAENVLNRTMIRSPQSGSVVNLKYHTIGGVIRPGDAILDVVPSQDDLIIEASVNPIDIASVHPGLVARVQLIALNYRVTPMITGVVTVVSADTVKDPNTKHDLYKIRIKINPNQLKNIPAASLYPGMPVNVLIVTGKRSLFFYLIKPLIDSMKTSFREKN